MCVEDSIQIIFDETNKLTPNDQVEDFEIGLTKYIDSSDTSNLKDYEFKNKERPTD